MALDCVLVFAEIRHQMPDVLTLKEAARFLRLSERSLYELARAQKLPAAQLGGKWLFPRRQLERWLAAQADAGAAQRLDPPPILAGSHDPLLDWAARQSGCGLALRGGGSLDGLIALAEGEAVVEINRCGAEELERYRAANVAFHETILAAASNRQLADTLRLVLNRPGPSLRRIVAFTPIDIRRRVDDHRRILEAITSGDPWRAELLMREHVSGIRGGAGRG
jgi:excisionase family DNA binding protein